MHTTATGRCTLRAGALMYIPPAGGTSLQGDASARKAVCFRRINHYLTAAKPQMTTWRHRITIGRLIGCHSGSIALGDVCPSARTKFCLCPDTAIVGSLRRWYLHSWRRSFAFVIKLPERRAARPHTSPWYFRDASPLSRVRQDLEPRCSDAPDRCVRAR